jgi:hypothetical protein
VDAGTSHAPLLQAARRLEDLSAVCRANTVARDLLWDMATNKYTHDEAKTLFARTHQPALPEYMEKALLAARTPEDRAAIRDALRFAAGMTPFHTLAYSTTVLEQDYLF